MTRVLFIVVILASYVTYGQLSQFRFARFGTEVRSSAWTRGACWPWAGAAGRSAPQARRRIRGFFKSGEQHDKQWRSLILATAKSAKNKRGRIRQAALDKYCHPDLCFAQPADCNHYHCNHKHVGELGQFHKHFTLRFTHGTKPNCGYSCSGYSPPVTRLHSSATRAK